MNIKSSIYHLGRLSTLLLITLLILPVLPFWHYYNLSFLITNLTIIALVFFQQKIPEIKVRLIDIGVLGLIASVLISNLAHIGKLPIANNFLVFLLMGGVYFSFILINKSKINFKIISNLLIICLTGIASFIFFVAFNQQFNYAQLTSKFNYINGLGNISQLSMYCCFYLIGIFYTQTNKWIIAGVSVLCLGLALVLHSKLILLVLFLVVASKLLSRFSFKVSLFTLFLFSGSTITYILLAPPSSLQGRIDLFKLSWINYDFSNFTGVGLGRFNSFINNGFVNGDTTNTIGHIDHLAFNDFTQIFIELGFPGIISLLLIFIGLVNKKNLFYSVAAASILFFMFPLQYIETAILFVLTIVLLKSNARVENLNYFYPKKYMAPILLSFSSLILFFNLTEMNVLKNWSETDKLLKQDKSTSQKLYNELELDLSNNDEYYLSFGVHLLKTKKYNEALKAFNKAKKINPSYESFIYIGDCYFELGHHKEAISNYEISKRIRPKHLYPVYKSIYALNNMGKGKDALEYWAAVKDRYTTMYSPKVLIMKEEIESLLADK